MKTTLNENRMEDDKSFVCKAEKVAAERACEPHTRSSMSVT
jgi:hypothetical protein